MTPTLDAVNSNGDVGGSRGTESGPIGQEPHTPPHTPPQRLIVVEPMLLLSIISGYPMDIIFSQFFYRRVGFSMGINVDNLTSGQNSTTESACDDDVNDTSYILRESVQAATAQWTLYINLAGLLPSILAFIIFGSLSDRIGRRFLFLLPPIGSILRASLLLCGLYFDLPVWVYFFNNIERCFGGFELVLVASFAYIADTASSEYLSLRMTFLDVLVLLGGGLSNLGVGYWIGVSGFFWPTAFVACGKCLAFIYAIFFIPESFKSKSITSNRKLSWRDFSKAVRLFAKDDGTGRRWRLNLLIFTYFTASLFNSRSLLRLFEMNVPLCWNSFTIGLYDGVGRLLKGVGSLVAVAMKKCIIEEWIVVVGRLSGTLEMLFVPLVQSTLMMFFVPVIGIFSIVAIPMTRALMSRLVRPEERGSLFAAMTVVYRLCSVAGELVANTIYSQTILFLEGRLVFILAGSTTFVAVVALIIYILVLRARQSPDRIAGSKTHLIVNCE